VLGRHLCIGRLRSVEEPQGSWRLWTYGYDAGFLTSVTNTSPSGTD